MLFSAAARVSSTYQVNKQCVLWIYDGFFSLCPECWWLYKITVYLFPALNVIPQRSSLAKGIGMQTSFSITETLSVGPFESFFRFVERFGSSECSQKLSSSIQTFLTKLARCVWFSAHLTYINNIILGFCFYSQNTPILTGATLHP